jgi:Uma2 family endonuclease
VVIQRLHPYWIKIQATVRLNDFSGPEPDVALMSGPPSPPAIERPTPLLIVEVSETTLDYDRNEKASLYAKIAIADYWVADVIAKQVEVFREPIRDASQRYGRGYGKVSMFGLHDRVVPLCNPQAGVDVSAFLS